MRAGIMEIITEIPENQALKLPYDPGMFLLMIQLCSLLYVCQGVYFSLEYIHSTKQCIDEGINIMIPQRNLHTHVQCYSSHNSCDMESASTPNGG